jgi:ApaG protein
MFEETTRNIRIAVTPTFLSDQSDPNENRYLWAYHITIENQGREAVQLLTRHWHITDARGRVREVEGPGVIGKQPMILPGRSHEYSSGVPLETPSGFMTGSYHMKSAGGDEFQVKIPLFALESPFGERRIH